MYQVQSIDSPPPSLPRSLAPSLPSPSSVPPIYFLLSPFSLAPSRLVACSLFAICARYGCWSCLAVVAAVAVEIFTTYVGLFHYLQHSRWGPRHTHKCYPEIAGERGIFALISSRTSGRSAFAPHSINWML